MDESMLSLFVWLTVYRLLWEEYGMVSDWCRLWVTKTTRVVRSLTQFYIRNWSLLTLTLSVCLGSCASYLVGDWLIANQINMTDSYLLYSNLPLYYSQCDRWAECILLNLVTVKHSLLSQLLFWMAMLHVTNFKLWHQKHCLEHVLTWTYQKPSDSLYQKSVNWVCTVLL